MEKTASRDPADPPSILEEISTRWPLVTDPLQFVLRYAPAVRRYLAALVKDAHDAEDVAQTFLLKVLHKPIARERVTDGRFRDYLKAALRNAAISHFRGTSRRRTSPANFDLVSAPDLESTADREWLEGWRSCLLRRAWEALEQHEAEAPEGLAYTVLRVAVDHPNEKSTELMTRVEKKTGRSLRPEAFRKQLSRARRRFAQLLVDAARQTLERPRADDVVEELIDLGLLEYVRDHLPEPFRRKVQSVR